MLMFLFRFGERLENFHKMIKQRGLYALMRMYKLAGSQGDLVGWHSTRKIDFILFQKLKQRAELKEQDGGRC